MALDASPASPQYERDLRGAHVDFKRNKDSVVKWSHGARPGTQARDPTGSRSAHLLLSVSDAFADAVDNGKMRPSRNTSLYGRHNIVKAHRGNFMLPASRTRATSAAILEVDDAKRLSRADMGGSFDAGPALPDALDAAAAAAVLYSFDNTDSPPPALTLAAFVKPNVRATEKLVEKEYEVLDANGDAVKGRKAREVLRKAATAAAADAVPVPDAAKPPMIEVLDEEDFELV